MRTSVTLPVHLGRRRMICKRFDVAHLEVMISKLLHFAGAADAPGSSGIPASLFLLCWRLASSGKFSRSQYCLKHNKRYRWYHNLLDVELSNDVCVVAFSLQIPPLWWSCTTLLIFPGSEHFFHITQNLIRSSKPLSLPEGCRRQLQTL